MDEPLTPDEEAVMGELKRLDLEPNEIPPALFEGFLQRLADSIHIPLQRVRVAMQGLIDKGEFDSGSGSEEEQKQSEREIIRELLLHDPELQELLKNIVADIVSGMQDETRKTG